MKKIGLWLIAVLLAAVPASAVRYGIKKQLYTGGTGANPSYLAYSKISDRMYSSNYGLSNVSVMSCADDSMLGTIPGTIYSTRMVYDAVNNRIYMKDSDFFTSIDCATNTIDTTFMISNGSAGVEYNPDNGKIYVNEGMSPIVYIYDPATYANLGSIIDVFGIMHYYSPNNSLYLPDAYAYDTLDVYSGTTDALTANIYVPTLSVNSSLVKMASNQSINRLYLLMPVTDQVAVINTTTNTLVNSLVVGDRPNSFALCPLNDRMFVACNGSSSNSLYYIDGSDAVDSVAVGDSVSTVVYNPADSLIYIGCWQSGYIKLVDPRLPSPVVIDSISTFLYANFMDMAADGDGEVYCAPYNSDFIYVVGQMPQRIWQARNSGMWSDYWTWDYSDDGGISWTGNAMMFTPDCATDSLITIDSTSMVTISGQAEYLDQIVIKSGASLYIQSQATLGDTTGYDLDVDGTLMITTSDFTQNGQIRFGPGSQYIHGVDGDTIPEADWDSLSTINLLGITTAVPAGLNKAFGTVTWDGASQMSDLVLAGEAGFSCRNLYVNSTGLARMIICSTTNPVVTIPGNLTVNSSATALIGITGTNVVKVGGTFSILNSGQFYISDSSYAAIDTLVLYGDYQHLWTSVHGGLPGTASMVFDGNRPHNYYGELNEMYGCVDIVVRPGSLLDVLQNATVGSGSAGSFTLMAGATLKVRDDYGFYASGTDNGAIRVNGARNYSKQANYYFCEGPGGYVYSGDGLPDTVNMLTIDNQSGSLPGWYQEYSSITVTDTFALLSGFIDANYPITILGPVNWGSGYINGSVPITVSGSGPDIVLPTTAGATLPVLTIDRPGRTVELPQNVNISDTLYLNNGSISNVGWGSTLAINNGATVQRTNGWVLGSFSKYIDTTTVTKDVVFETGTKVGYAPVTMSFDTVNYDDFLEVVTVDTSHYAVSIPDNCIQRYWMIRPSNNLGFLGNATFSYLPSEFGPGFSEALDESTMVVGGYNTSWSVWEMPDIGTRTPGGISDGGSIQITGLNVIPAFKKNKFTDLGSTSEFTIAKNIRALQPTKMWRLAYDSLTSYYYWNSGPWETSSDGGMTWNYAMYPDSFPTYLDSTIIIQPWANMTISSDLAVDEMIDSGIVNITGGTFVIHDGPGTDMVVNGTIYRQGGSVNVNTGATLLFEPWSQYVHQLDGDTIPAATWDSLSTLSLNAVINTMPAGMDQAFGNIAWDGTQQAGDMILPGGPSFSAWNVYINSTGASNIILTSAAKPEVTMNELMVNNGSAILGQGGNRKLHVKGNLYVYDPGWLYLTDTLNAGIDTLFLYGSYSHMMAGIGGGGPDSTAFVFCGTDTQYYNANSEVLTGYINYQVNPGATLKLPEWSTFAMGNPGDFTLMPGASLVYSDYWGLYPAGQDTGVIRNLGARNYSQGANYHIYGISTGPYYTGPGLPDTVNQLTIDSYMDQVYLSRDLAVMDTLRLLANTLRFDEKRLSLFGPVKNVSNGLRGDSTSQLALMGGSTSFLMLPSQLRDLGTLTVNRPAAIIMTDSLRIFSRLDLMRGSFNNGSKPLTFQDGVSIYRTGSSTLTGAGPITFVNQVGLEYGAGIITAGPEMPTSSSAIMYLALKGASDTLIVNRDTLNVWNSLSVSGGIKFNGKSFSSYGLIDTVGSAGELIFADSSRANIFGSIDSMFLPGIRGGTVNIDNMYGSAMRRDIDVFGPLTLTSGGLAVGPHSLMLGDSLAGSGLLSTDSTSSLVFYGQPVSQTMPSTLNHLSKLSWDRTVPLYVTTPLVLHDTLMLVQGVIDNSTNLTLRSGVTIARNSGILMMPATIEGPVNLVYGSHGGGTLATGNEIPGNASDLYHLTLGLNTQPGDTIVLSSNAQVNGRLSLYEGVLNVGSKGLTILDTIDLFAGQLLTDSTSFLKILNSPYMVRLPTTVKNLDSLILSSFSGLELADTVLVRSGYRQTTGRIGFGQLVFGPSASLIYDNLGADTTSGFEYPDINGPANLTVATGGALQLHSSKTVKGDLNLNGVLSTGANTITIDTLGHLWLYSGYVDGNLSKLIPVSADTLVYYELGTASGGYSEAGLRVYNNTTPSFVTVGINGMVYPLTNDSSSCLKKFWTFSGTGLAADSSRITLNYLPSDFNIGFSEAADESTMVAGRHDNGATPGWQFPNVVARNIFGNNDGGSIVLSHTGDFVENPAFTLGRDSLAIVNLAADTTLPFIASNTPLDGATGIGLTDSVRITFSEPVRKSLIGYSFLPNPGIVDTVWSSDSTSVVFNHSNFAELTTYVVKVTGVQDTAANSLTGRDSMSFTTMALPDTIGPYISFVQPYDGQTGVMLDEPILIGFSEPVDSLSFRFTCTPDPGGWIQTWDSLGFNVFLYHSNLTPGANYLFSVDSISDISGNPLRTDTVSVINPWTFEAQPYETLSVAWNGGAYRLFSIPLKPSINMAYFILGDDLGAYSDSTWLMFGYKPSVDSFVSAPSVYNGYGYWLATAKNATIDAQGLKTLNYATVGLEAGWNLIGCPFMNPVAVPMIEVRDSTGMFHMYNDTSNNMFLNDSLVRQRMWTYNDNSYDFVNNGAWDSLSAFDTSSHLQAWEGYAVYALAPCSLSMMPAYKSAAKGIAITEAPKSEVFWQAQFSVTSGNAADRGIRMGVSPQARAGYDRLDAEKPPLVSNSITAYIPHDDWNQGPCRAYQYDFRPPADYIEWPLMVKTASDGQPSELSYTLSGTQDGGYSLYLVDRRTNKATSLSGSGKIGFSGSQEFAVIYTRQSLSGLDLRPLSFDLNQTYPNPFTQSITVNYQLSAAAHVSLKVYNVAGQLVRTLSDGQALPGYYSQVWNGCDNGGRRLASGIYIMHLASGGQVKTRKLVKIQ